ncbi:hypothetical protein [Faecalibacterium prausnitzii]|mgnify:FL=1|jgi:hypothetical protein|uniref:hypothetical protein n=1 Tax=Faecalibacterium prausnitzii TaxID=853 RepID=UPI001C2BC196|nr:hypothetical protein [Faecalibacterium prausnitzii]MBV0898578.1 hypothetical protein [Faecalibacterium prausnitzii]MCQ5163679.1 hypothetical protein [Faecalibacterium prausnitzii]MCQ5177326.1 hypothetical protein [Faecalibacterium prausnitzii]
MKNKVTLLNMISGLILQFFTLISGFILPKIILTCFGSEVNGLVSSLNQFLSYITLVEGGITGVIVANLYKPIVEQDNNKISSVLVTADRFYKKIGALFIAYSVILSIIYPLHFKTEFTFSYVCSLTLILSLTLLIQYMYSLTLRTLLNADKKGYVVNFTQTLIVIFNVLFALISVFIYPSIHVLKLISGSLFLLQPLIFNRYVKKNYKIDWKVEPDNSLIKSRWNGFAINLAAFIHNSTDVTVLTFLANLKTVSIYSVYSLVSSGIKQMINACLSGIAHTVGQAYAKKNWKELNQKLDIYEYIVLILVFFLFTVTALLITPFVQLYTKDIVDTDYNQPLFGFLLVLAEALYLIKLPHLNLAYSANKFKEITVPAYIEAMLNIMISVALVKWIGLIGVTIGTIVGMTYRMVFHVYYTSKIVPGRAQCIFYRKLFLFAAGAGGGFVFCYKLLPLQTVTVGSWIVHAIFYCVVMGAILLAISILFFQNEMKFFWKYVKRK